VTIVAGHDCHHTQGSLEIQLLWLGNSIDAKRGFHYCGTGGHMIKKSTVAALVLSGFLLAGEALFAQNAAQTTQPAADRDRAASIDEQIAMLRLDLRSTRKQVVAANMKLSDAEAEKFWPIYDQYVKELVDINNAKYALIKEYLQNTNMTDEQADSLSKRWIEVDSSVVQLRLKYIPIFRKALSAKGTAMFFQLDRRVQMMIDLQLASAIPLVQP
jgi:outer membrane murein-binding lipoprotein Lpp